MKASYVPLVIDGPNFINRILDMGIDKDIIANQLSLDGLRASLNRTLNEMNLTVQIDLVEFVCSKRLFGNGKNKFTQVERDSMISKIGSERGVHIEEVNLPGTSEKGVDTTVSTFIDTLSDNYDHIFFTSHDRDYVPILKKIREKRKKLFLIALNDCMPFELCNEAYQNIKINDKWRDFFTYSYPRYYVQEDFTKETMKNMIANADDRLFNQLRIDYDGWVYYSHGARPDMDKDGVKFYFETAWAYNGYVGPKAASDSGFLEIEYADVVNGWKSGAKGYYDYHISLEEEDK
jgi:hypothetical protein